MPVDKPVAEYFEAARGWDFDRAQAAMRSAKKAWIVAGLASTVAVVSVGAVAALSPLKTVEPFVIRVDSRSGVVDVVPALAGAMAESQALTRYLVTQYVIARERFVPALAEADYERVGAFHTPQMNQAWAAAWDRSNPDSPLNRHADGSAVHVKVTSVSFLRPGSGREDLVQVRFVRLLGEGRSQRQQPFVATLQYAYGRAAKDDRMRAANPLGFKVVEYRKEPELVQASSEPGAMR